jgi:hypothetical protein
MNYIAGVAWRSPKMQDNGWIKLHRKIQDNEYYFAERFTKMGAWIDLMILATHKGKTFYIRGNEVKIESGQVGYSIKSLSKRWKWNDRTVTRHLNSLQTREMIQYRTNHLTTIITILNWQDYQNSTAQDTEQDTVQTQNRIQTNKNDKNVKNDKEYNIYAQWNEFAVNNHLAQILQLSDKRRSAINKRLSEKEFDMAKIFELIKMSDFLLGKKGDWKVTFDFVFCSTTNYLKILEGKYTDRAGIKPTKDYTDAFGKVKQEYR